MKIDMKKQTAVEWQFEQLFNSFEKFNNGEYSFNEYLKRNLEIREQSKEMEKQQRTYAYDYGKEDVFDWLKTMDYDFLVEEFKSE